MSFLSLIAQMSNTCVEDLLYNNSSNRSKIDEAIRNLRKTTSGNPPSWEHFKNLFAFWSRIKLTNPFKLDVRVKRSLNNFAASLKKMFGINRQCAKLNPTISVTFTIPLKGLSLRRAPNSSSCPVRKWKGLLQLWAARRSGWILRDGN